MAEISSRQIDKLEEAFASPERISDGAMLAGNALTLPILAARRRQARLEAARTERRLGADHRETKARRADAQALAARETLVRQEVARQRLVKPAVADQAGLYGRITRKGEAVAGVAVAALDEQGQSLAHSCTGHRGEYSLSFAPDTPVAVEVRDESRRLYRDETAAPYPPYRAVHRDIELSRARPVCPGDKPAEPGGQVQVPNLIGMSREQAEKSLAALGLQPGKGRSRKGPQPDIVLDHQPAPGATVKPGASVELTVSVADDKPASNLPDLTGRSLHQAIEEIGKAGGQLGTVTVATDGGRTPLVRSSKPDAKGEKIDLELSTTSGDVQMMTIVAAVLAVSPEGAAVGLDSPAAASEWLRARKLVSAETMGETLALDDVALRRRVRLKPDEPVEPVRALLKAGVARVRRT